MARLGKSARKELRSYAISERKARIREGFRFGGFGAASVWVWPIVLVAMFCINAFLIGLPANRAINAELGHKVADDEFLYWGSMAPGLVLAVIGLFRVKGRFWSLLGAPLSYFLAPYTIMLLLAPAVGEIPGWFDSVISQLTGG